MDRQLPIVYSLQKWFEWFNQASLEMYTCNE